MDEGLAPGQMADEGLDALINRVADQIARSFAYPSHTFAFGRGRSRVERMYWAGWFGTPETAGARRLALQAAPLVDTEEDFAE